MSQAYIQRLRRIQAEFHAAQDTLIYVGSHWQRQNISLAIERISPRDIREAGQNVEATYLIRLYAEFEGILKDHLATNHPRIRVPDKPKVDWLISRVVQAETLTIEQPLRVRLDEVRDYRNSIAHHSRRAGPFVTFGTALSVLNTFLARLPEPIKSQAKF